MTVSNTTSYKSYQGDGSTVEFPVPFKFFANTDLEVTLGVNGVESVLTLDADYTVSGAGDENGGAVTVSAVPIDGSTLVIRRALPLLQEADYRDGDGFPAAAHEGALDRLTMICQQLRDELDRVAMLPVGSALADLRFPNPAPGYAIGWDALGAQLANISPASLAAAGALDHIGNYDSLDDALTTIGFSPQALLINQAVTVSANTTIPSTLQIWGSQGGRFNVPTGVTLTMPVPQAGDIQIFSLTGTAKVNFTGPGVVKASWFGVTGSGDETTELAAAIYSAENADLPLDLGNNRTITYSSAISVELPPALLGTDVILDCSGSTISTVFQRTGTKTLIGESLALANGAYEATVTAGNYPFGTTILITADENNANTSQSYFRKGSRHKVDVDPAGGTTLGFWPRTQDTFTAAYVWLVTEKQFYCASGITFRGNKTAAVPGSLAIKLRFCSANIYSHFNDFTYAAVSFVDSAGFFGGTVRGDYIAGYGYGIGIFDLSDVLVSSPHIKAARHAVAAGGGGDWNTNEMGGADAPAAFGASYSLVGGFYANSKIGGMQAVETHGCVNRAVISGAIIDGGIKMGARTALITGTEVSFLDTKAFMIADTNSTSWGEYIISGCVFRQRGISDSTNGNAWLGFNSAAQDKCKLLYVGGGTRFEKDNVTTDTLGVVLTGAISTIIFDGVSFKRAAPSSGAPQITISQYGDLYWNNVKSDGLMAYITPKAAGLTAIFKDVTTLNSLGAGLRILSDTDHGYSLLVVDGLTAKDCFSYGCYINAAVRDYIIRNLVMRGNNPTATAAICNLKITGDANVKSLTVENNDLQDTQDSPTQPYGFNITIDNSSTAVVSLANNNGCGCTSGNVLSGSGLVIKNQYGNRATAGTVLPDVIQASDGDLFQINAAGVLAAFP